MSASIVLPIPGLEPNPAATSGITEPVEPRPGSRAARLAVPLATDVLKEIATEYGVCVHPLGIRRINTETGQSETIDIPCGARLASKCAPCAEKNRRARLQQLRYGWHLDEEPAVTPRAATGDERALVELRAHYEFERLHVEATARWDQIAELDEAIREVSEAIAEAGLRGTLPASDLMPDLDSESSDDQEEDDSRKNRTRSTRRRQDVPDLPRMKVSPRTVGRVFTAPDGTTHRDSMLLTVTLDSYGEIHAPRRANRPVCPCGTTHHPDDPKIGTPVDPASYDYRRAALDAIHFARFLDRFWQNLRRACGLNVQYGGCVELQKRLAPHGHFAIRGTIPRALVRKVAAATYHQVWWPPHDQLMHSPTNPPRWDSDHKAWVDPITKEALHLVSWAKALDALDDDPGADPAHVVYCGRVDPRGVKAGSKDAERTIRYITKYLTKDITEHVTPTADPQRAHFDRLHAELSVLPCSPTCANWILYGIKPKGASSKLKPGNCPGQGPPARVTWLHRPSGPDLPAMVRQNADRPPRRQSRLGQSPSGSRQLGFPDHVDSRDQVEGQKQGAGHLKRLYEYELCKPGDARPTPRTHPRHAGHLRPHAMATSNRSSQTTTASRTFGNHSLPPRRLTLEGMTSPWLPRKH